MVKLALLAGLLGWTGTLAAQGRREAIVQIEVADSIGLPLPDAKTEVFTFMNGSVFWEWVGIDSTALPAGINLLRFSYPGYKSATFSVPVREGGKLSLRVRLEPEGDTTKRATVVHARQVRAIGLALEGRAKTDIIGHRLTLVSHDVEREPTNRFGPLMRRTRNSELRVFPARGGSFAVYAQDGGPRCQLPVMINGDRRRILPFDTFDQMFSVADVETIEIFPRAGSIPLAYQPMQGGCGLMIVWFKVL
jgi:hypothetical protein